MKTPTGPCVLCGLPAKHNGAQFIHPSCVAEGEKKSPPSPSSAAPLPKKRQVTKKTSQIREVK